MLVTRVESFLISNRRVLVKISTDSGPDGWGEATLENWARPIVATVAQMGEYLVGKDPRLITHHWQVLARGGFYRGGPVMASALAGLDQALWDITARSLQAPIHQLLGGAVRSSIRIYAHSNQEGSTGGPGRATELVESGYTMVKVAPFAATRFLESPEYVETLVSDLEAMRRAVGPSIDLALDMHGRFSAHLSRRVLPLLEPIGLMFVEEPLRPEHSALIGDIVRSTSIPIATGERLYSRTEFRAVLEAGVAVVQPDLSHAGGITECFRIATQAEVYDAQIAPHCPLGPVALAACLQVDAAVPNFLAQESVIDTHLPDLRLGLELLHNPEVLAPVSGHIPVLQGPGLGIEIDEDAVRGHIATAPLAAGAGTWFYESDNSFAEW